METALSFIQENKQIRKKTKTTQNNDNNNTNFKAHINKQANNSKNNKFKKKKERKNKQNNNNNNNSNNNKLKSNKIIQLITVVPELVTLDYSLTHVLQASNTQPYHSVKSWMDWGYM